MAKIESYQRRNTLPPSPLAPKVNPRAMTPEADAAIGFGQTVAGLGSQMMGMATAKAEKTKQAYDFANRLDAESQFDIYLSEQEAALSGRTDTENFISEFDSRTPGKIDSLLGTTSDVNQKTILQARLNYKKVIGRGRIQSVAMAKDVQIKTATYDLAVESLLTDGMHEEARFKTQQHHLAGLSTTAQFNDKMTYIDTEELFSLGLAQSDYESGLNAINTSEIGTRTEKAAAISKFKLQTAATTQAAELALTEARDTARTKFAEMIPGGDLVAMQEHVLNGPYDGAEKTQKITWLQDEGRRIVKNVPIATDVVALEAAKMLADSIDDQVITLKDIEILAGNLRMGYTDEGGTKHPPSIDDTDYTALMTVARSSQEAGVRAAKASAHYVGVQQIVGKEIPLTLGQSLETLSAAQIAQAIAAMQSHAQTAGEKLRWRLYGDYMTEVREWFSKPENRDKTKESYQFTAGKAQLYKNIASLDEGTVTALRKVSARTGKSFSELGGEPAASNGTKKYKKGDTQTKGGVTYTYNGKDWEY